MAAMLPSRWAQRLVDLNVTRLTQKDLAGADYVFVSAMIVQRDSARSMLARCKPAGGEGRGGRAALEGIRARLVNYTIY